MVVFFPACDHIFHLNSLYIFQNVATVSNEEAGDIKSKIRVHSCQSNEDMAPKTLVNLIFSLNHSSKLLNMQKTQCTFFFCFTSMYTYAYIFFQTKERIHLQVLWPPFLQVVQPVDSRAYTHGREAISLWYLWEGVQTSGPSQRPQV